MIEASCSNSVKVLPGSAMRLATMRRCVLKVWSPFCEHNIRVGYVAEVTELS